MMRLISAWWHKMTNGIGEDRIIVHYNAEQAIDLEELSGSFAAFAKQHRRTWRETGRRGPGADVRLYITKVESGSIIVEVAAAVNIFHQVHTVADYALVFEQFYTRVRDSIGHYAEKKSQSSQPTDGDARELREFIRPLIGRTGATLGIKRARFSRTTSTTETLAEYEFDAPKLEQAERQIAEQLDDSTEKTSSTHRNVLMYWHQTNKDEAKESGKTGDLAVIPVVSHDPLPVLFASEKASLKRKMMDTDSNPFLTAFYVDVSVQYVDGEATAYGLLELHKFVPLKESGDDDV